MQELTGFTDQARQESSFVLDDGTRVVMVLEYKSNQIGWFADITRGDFALTGYRLVPSPNWIRQWREVLPFGLLVRTDQNQEVMNQTDLVDGVCSICLLSAAEVAEVESTAYPSARVLATN